MNIFFLSKITWRNGFKSFGFHLAPILCLFLLFACQSLTPDNCPANNCKGLNQTSEAIYDQRRHLNVLIVEHSHGRGGDITGDGASYKHFVQTGADTMGNLVYRFEVETSFTGNKSEIKSYCFTRFASEEMKVVIQLEDTIWTKTTLMHDTVVLNKYKFPRLLDAEQQVLNWTDVDRHH